MAWIEKRTGKKQTTYRISVSSGTDGDGKPIIQRLNWSPDAGMTQRQIEKALNRIASDFERSVEKGYQLDQKQTFREYAAYVMSLKERTGIRPRTIDRYAELLVRINKAIGHIKLSNLRPQHLNAFYENLGECGVRKDGVRAIARMDIAEWLQKENMSRASLARQAGVAASTVTEVLKGNPVSCKTADAIAGVIGKSRSAVFSSMKDSTPLSDKTILEYHRLISSILAQAEKELLIPYNPAAKATPPRVRRKEPDYYQPDVLDSILDALDQAPLKWKTITYLLIDTGCRRGEVAGLKWESVDLDSEIITVERALLYSSKRGVYEGPPKNGKSRTVKLAPETISLLRQHQCAQNYLQQVNGDRWIETGYVFTRENGDRMNPDSITDWLNKFSAANQLPHIHPHAFRHTAASTMIANGVDLVTAANELGHANAVTTATIYSHQIATAKAKASEVRSAAFSHRKANIAAEEDIGE